MRKQLGRIETRAMLGMFGRLALAALILAGICVAGRYWLLADWAVQPFFEKLGYLLLTIAVAAAAFFLTAMALGVQELTAITAAVRRRLARRG
jgi:hypothetical protein